MLTPTNRRIYTEDLEPPVGMAFDRGLAMTYSLNPGMILAAAIGLTGTRLDEDEKPDAERKIEIALDLCANNLSVFVQEDKIVVPKMTDHTVLFPLLEKTIVQVGKPENGVFHPKIWLLRYIPRNQEKQKSEDAVYRLIVLSRNMTFDNSWDFSLLLDGKVRNKPNDFSVSLTDFIENVLKMPRDGKSENLQEWEKLLKELTGLQWEIPPGFDEMSFFYHGLEKQKLWNGWRKYEKQGRLLVISPFCNDRPLQRMADRINPSNTTLISTSETLTILKQETRQRYGETEGGNTRCFTLSAGVVPETNPETEGNEVDAEDSHVEPVRPTGLHAKIYVYEHDDSVSLAMGSANATVPALGNCGVHAPLNEPTQNVEVVVELVGKTNTSEDDKKRKPSYTSLAEQLFRKDDTSSENGPSYKKTSNLGSLLEAFPPPTKEDVDETKAKIDAEYELEKIVSDFAKRDFYLKCGPPGEKGNRELILHENAAKTLEHSVRLWPITCDDQIKVAEAGTKLTEFSLGRFPLKSITGLIAASFEHWYKVGEMKKRLVKCCALNLRIENLDEIKEFRFAAIRDNFLKTPEDFYRYIAYYFEAIFGDWIEIYHGQTGGNHGSGGDVCGPCGIALLEELIRRFSRTSKENLQRFADKINSSVKERRSKLTKENTGDEWAEFLNRFEPFWTTFYEAIQEVEESP